MKKEWTMRKALLVLCIRKCRVRTSSADISVSSVSAQTDPGREYFRS